MTSKWSCQFTSQTHVSRGLGNFAKFHQNSSILVRIYNWIYKLKISFLPYLPNLSYQVMFTPVDEAFQGG